MDTKNERLAFAKKESLLFRLAPDIGGVLRFEYQVIPVTLTLTMKGGKLWPRSLEKKKRKKSSKC